MMDAAFARGREPKALRDGTHRVCSLGETWERITPLLSGMGITRIANVTGLDVLGIPVALALRPNSRSLAGSQGKGVSLLAAKVSAVMEAVETYHAERLESPTNWSSFRDISRDADCIDVSRLSRPSNSRYRDDLPITWIEGMRWPNCEPVMVSLEVVSTDYRVIQAQNSNCFLSNTNGLASGNTITEAIAHGLYEVIERDAMTLWTLQGKDAREKTGVDLGTVDCIACLELVGRFDRAGLDLRVWNLTTDIGVPAFFALAVEERPDGLEIETGAGCHPNKAVALSRALTEAAQSRLTRITGSRDDLDPELIGPAGRAYRMRRAHLIPKSDGRTDFGLIASADSEDIATDLSEVISRLSNLSVDDVVVCDLTRRDIGIPVVKVLVTDLETPIATTPEKHASGKRGRALLNRRG